MALPQLPTGQVGAAGAANALARTVIVKHARKIASWVGMQQLVEIGFDWVDDAGFDGTFSDLSRGQLLEKLKLRAKDNNKSLAEQLQMRERGNQAVAELVGRGVADVEALDSSLEAEQLDVPPPELQRTIASLNPMDLALATAACTARCVISGKLDDDAKKTLNKATRKKMDGQRVSREEHEYRYCLSSGQIQEVFTAGGVQAPPQLRYGAFVESKEMRKAIELLRRLRRFTHARNAKRIASLMNTTPGQLYLTVRGQNTAVFTSAANEFLSFSTGS